MTPSSFCFVATSSTSSLLARWIAAARSVSNSLFFDPLVTFVLLFNDVSNDSAFLARLMASSSFCSVATSFASSLSFESFVAIKSALNSASASGATADGSLLDDILLFASPAIANSDSAFLTLSMALLSSSFVVASSVSSSLFDTTFVTISDVAVAVVISCSCDPPVFGLLFDIIDTIDDSIFLARSVAASSAVFVVASSVSSRLIDSCALAASALISCFFLSSLSS